MPKILCRLLFFTSLCLISCSEDVVLPEYDKFLVEKETIRLQLDSITPVDNTYFTFETINDTGFLFLINSIYNSIDVYRQDNGQFYKRFKFEKQGPEGIAQLQGYTVVNADSIFVFGKFHIAHTKIIDWQGNFRALQPVSLQTARDYPIINHLSASGGYTYLHNNKLYFTTFTLLDDKNPDNFNSDIKFEYCYDLSKDTLTLMPFTYPEDYWDRTQPRFAANPYRDKGEGEQFVYSWPKEPYLIKWDYDTNKISQHSAHDPRIEPLIPQDMMHRPTPEEEMQVGVEHAFYMRILYDKYRKLYYRIAFLPIEFDKNRHTSYTANFERPFAVLVLHENFQPIALRVFETINIYNAYSAFVGTDGLYIAKNNPNREDLNEDVLELSIFELQ